MPADVSEDSLAPQPLDSWHDALPASLQTLIGRYRDVPIPLDRSNLPHAVSTSDVLALARRPPAVIFPGARCPEGALAGLLLFAGHWSSAHKIVDHSETPDGCYWHALVHRMEPDAANSGYWFGQAGRHPLFPAVLDAARRVAAQHPDAGVRFESEWNPSAFNGWCEEARQKPQLPRSSVIAAIHSAECHLLWNYSLEGLQAEKPRA